MKEFWERLTKQQQLTVAGGGGLVLLILLIQLFVLPFIEAKQTVNQSILKNKQTSEHVVTRYHQ